MNILLAEDDPVSRLSLESILRSLGHTVMTADNGHNALALLDRQPARVAVCDWQMPGMDGLELCRRLRQRQDDYIYFILVTDAEHSAANEDLAMAAGVDDFISKPVGLRELRHRLRVAERILGYNRRVKILEEILPICGYCKKVRDDQNYWEQIDRYIATHSDTKISHGICPDCYQKIVEPQLRALGIDNPQG